MTKGDYEDDARLTIPFWKIRDCSVVRPSRLLRVVSSSGGVWLSFEQRAVKDWKPRAFPLPIAVFLSVGEVKNASPKSNIKGVPHRQAPQGSAVPSGLGAVQLWARSGN